MGRGRRIRISRAGFGEDGAVAGRSGELRRGRFGRIRRDVANLRGAGALRAQGAGNLRRRLRAAEFGKGAEVGAVRGGDLIEKALEAVRAEAAGVDDAVERAGFVRFSGHGAEQFGLDAEEAPAEPIAVHESVDEITLDGSARLKRSMVPGGEGLEFGGVLAGDDGRLRVNPVFQGIETGGVPAGVRTRSSEFLRVEAVGFDLAESSHSAYRVTGRQAEIGDGAGQVVEEADEKKTKGT